MKTHFRNWFCKTFPGFYESILYNSDTLYWHERDSLPEGFCWDFTKDGYKNFEKETCEDWVYAISQNFEENPIDMKIGKLVDIWSPREYNFSTDKITFEVEVNLNKLKKWCWETMKEDFDNFLHEHFTSCDGFWSFTPNNLHKFKNEYSENQSKDNLIDVMIEYYLLKNVNFDDVLLDCMDNDWERIHNNITLQSEDDWSLWDYEFDQDTEKCIPTQKISA